MRALPDNNPWVGRMAELVEDWRFVLLSRGWKFGLTWFAKQLILLPYRSMPYVIMSRSLAEPLPDHTPKIALAIRPFVSGDLTLVRSENLPSEARLFARRLEMGHTGLVACHGAQVAGYSWACTDTTLERLELRLEAGDVLFTDSFTIPAFRGQGVQTALSVVRMRQFRERGYTRAVMYIEEQNQPSLAVWRRLGAQVTARVRFRRLGFWRSTLYGS